MRVPLLLLALAACDAENPFRAEELSCEERQIWYPLDGGEEVIISCDDPGEGWTLDPPDSDDAHRW
ncbi:MAG: hypothetical protein EA397_08145 [Deltaproteobacteria bacterium]|nr:MAG: hypothetical protein EA397_08145 [Deltaproteobacteria bacterium]